jgi:putative transposase
MTEAQRKETLQYRKEQEHPWHGPPHPDTDRSIHLITAACYEHKPIISTSPQRISDFESILLDRVIPISRELHAWCVLPNHYHLLVSLESLEPFVREIGKIHGSTSFTWNGEDHQRGRHVWYRSSDRGIRSDRHFWTSMNYVHHNPVRHGYVNHWQDWPWSSARGFLERYGRANAEEIWKGYPLRDYGKGWDDLDTKEGP